jgi:hypothetical protein
MADLFREFRDALAAGNDPVVSDEAALPFLRAAERTLAHMALTAARDAGEVWLKMRAAELDSESVDSYTDAALRNSATADIARLAGIAPYDSRAPRDRSPARRKLEAAIRASISARGDDWYREEILAPHGVVTSAALTMDQLAAVAARLPFAGNVPESVACARLAQGAGRHA